MKVKLSIDSDFVGYKNIKPNEINTLYDNSIDELYCDQEILSMIPNKEFKAFCQLLYSKIRHSGALVITGVDFNVINNDFMYNKIDEDFISETLNGSKGFYSCSVVENTLRSLGIKIHKMSIENYFFSVKGIRQ